MQLQACWLPGKEGGLQLCSCGSRLQVAHGRRCELYLVLQEKEISSLRKDMTEMKQTMDALMVAREHPQSEVKNAGEAATSAARAGHSGSPPAGSSYGEGRPWSQKDPRCSCDCQACEDSSVHCGNSKCGGPWTTAPPLASVQQTGVSFGGMAGAGRPAAAPAPRRSPVVLAAPPIGGPSPEAFPFHGQPAQMIAAAQAALESKRACLAPAVRDGEDMYLVTKHGTVRGIWEEFNERGPFGKMPIVQRMALRGRGRWYLQTGKDPEGTRNRVNVWNLRNFPIVCEVLWQLKVEGKELEDALLAVEAMQAQSPRKSIDSLVRYLNGKKGHSGARGALALHGTRVHELLEEHVKDRRTMHRYPPL